MVKNRQVERRWLGQFMKPLTFDDASDLIEFGRDNFCLDEMVRLDNGEATYGDYDPALHVGEVDFYSFERRRRWLPVGCDLLVDDVPPRPDTIVRVARVEPHSFPDHLAHTSTPWGQRRFGNDLRTAAVVAEAFPVDASIDSLEVALGMLPSLPPLTPEDARRIERERARSGARRVPVFYEPPDYDAALEGPWAEWVIEARRLLDPFYGWLAAPGEVG